jgi:hypothetical protein
LYINGSEIPVDSRRLAGQTVPLWDPVNRACAYRTVQKNKKSLSGMNHSILKWDAEAKKLDCNPTIDLPRWPVRSGSIRSRETACHSKTILPGNKCLDKIRFLPLRRSAPCYVRHDASPTETSWWRRFVFACSGGILLSGTDEPRQLARMGTARARGSTENLVIFSLHALRESRPARVQGASDTWQGSRPASFTSTVHTQTPRQVDIVRLIIMFGSPASPSC